MRQLGTGDRPVGEADLVAALGTTISIIIGGR